MYDDFEKWLNRIIEENPDISGEGVVFNLYEDADLHWSIQLVTTSYVDLDDEDWKCDETFTTGEDLFTWKQETDWEEILELSIETVKQYLKKGKYADCLKSYQAAGIGFVDGDLEILYTKN